jgi:predicted MFS family arabinose efflux permease
VPSPFVSGLIGIGYVLLFQMSIIAAAQAFPILAPMAASAYGVTPEFAGYFSAIVFASALMASNGLAGLLRRIGSLKSAALTLVISASGVLILSVTASLAGLVIAALVLGIAYGPVNPAGSRVLLRVTRGFRRNLVFSIKQTSVAIGGAVAGALLPVAAITLGWREGMVALAVMVLIAAAVAWPVLSRLGDDGDPTASIRPMGPLGPARAMISESPLRALALSIFAFSATQFGLMSIYVTYLWGRAGLPPATSAAMLSIALGASVAGRIGWGWLADSRSPIRILSGLSAAGAVAMMAMLLLLPGTPLFLSVLVSLALGLGPLSWSGVFLAEVAQEGITRGGDQAVVSITAGMMVFGYLGGVLGPAGLSLSVFLLGDYWPGVLVIATLLAISAVTLLRQGRTIPKPVAGGPLA